MSRKRSSKDDSAKEGRVSVLVACIGAGGLVVAAAIGAFNLYVKDEKDAKHPVATASYVSPVTINGDHSSNTQIQGNSGPVQTGSGVQINNMAPEPDPMATLKDAIATRPAGDIGQVSAVEQLVRKGKSLESFDLRGISLPAAKLDRGEFSRSNMTLTNLEKCHLDGASLDEVSLYFARMKQIQANGADMTDARLYFADVSGGKFVGIRAPRSNWQATSARGANFRNAQLQGASFMMADLRGADFTGADLSGAFFIGAIVTGANFTDAKILNTDFSAATGSATEFTAKQQAGMCATSNGGRPSYNYTIRRFDATKPETDSQYRDLLSVWVPLHDGTRYLRPCAKRTNLPQEGPPIWSGNNGEALQESFALNLPAIVVDASSREQQLLSLARKSLDVIVHESGVGGFIKIRGRGD